MSDTSSPSIHTTTHAYPAREVSIWRTFYGQNLGRIVCPVTKQPGAQNCHMVDAAISTSTVQSMLDHNLIDNRDPQHLAELRENVIPLRADLNLSMDSGIFCLFLHEDILARVFQFEYDVIRIRESALASGRPDPGRPPYREAYEWVRDPTIPGPTTTHRIHCMDPLPTLLGLFAPEACPGCHQDSQLQIHTIETLLSIPFSIIGNIPRLVRFFRGDAYHIDVLGLATSIVAMWFWKPNQTHRLTDALDVSVQDDPVQWPNPVFHPSRENQTFQLLRSSRWAPRPSQTTSTDNSSQSSSQVLTDGSIFLGSADIVWDKEDGLCAIPGPSLSMIKPSKQTSSEEVDVWDSVSNFESEDSKNSTESAATAQHESTQLSKADIEDWCHLLAMDSSPSAPDISRSHFERGEDTHQSVNDYLLSNGLLSPATWLAFHDLTIFSHK